MTTVQRLKPRFAEAYPRCEAGIVDPLSQEYRQRATPGDIRCRRAASVLIDGVNLCGQHAAVLALGILSGEKEETLARLGVKR